MHRSLNPLLVSSLHRASIHLFRHLFIDAREFPDDARDLDTPHCDTLVLGDNLFIDQTTVLQLEEHAKFLSKRGVLGYRIHLSP